MDPPGGCLQQDDEGRVFCRPAPSSELLQVPDFRLGALGLDDLVEGQFAALTPVSPYGRFVYTLNYGQIVGGDGVANDVTITVTSVPEPAFASLLAVGAFGILSRRRRRAKPTREFLQRSSHVARRLAEVVSHQASVKSSSLQHHIA